MYNWDYFFFKVHIRELPFFAQKLAALSRVERYIAELKRINMS